MFNLSRIPDILGLTNMSWVKRGHQSSGLVQLGSAGQTAAVPALATHRGALWCLWSDANGGLYYAIGDNDTFQPRIGFPDSGIPVLAEVLGILHSIIIRPTLELTHYIFDDANDVWGPPAVLSQDGGFVSATTPALIAFHNKLFLAFVNNGILSFSIWTINDNAWTPPVPISSTGVSGIPAAFLLQGDLHVLCSSAVEDREILGFVYDVPSNTWSPRDDVSEGKAAVGVSATSFGESAFLGFQENGPGDTSRSIYVAEYHNGAWKQHEAVADQSSFDPPQLAVLNGRINCVFNTNDESKNLTWFSRPLLDFSLSSWMSEIPDDTLLSNMTIPGTHDSCAESNIPFVRTQYLSVAKQMEAGLRFLDLRLRVDAKGDLYCYHGGIAINWPKGLKFTDVMNAVFKFMSTNNDKPTETVLVSINNDDVSGKTPPEVFYNAVKTHIEATPTWPDGTPKWSTSRTTITLGEARGKAVLLRRFHADPSIEADQRIGIDLSGWLNNNPDFTLTTPENECITIQDKWQYIDPLPLHALVESKTAFVETIFRKARDGRPEDWYINFASAVGVPSMKGEVAESHWIAVGAHRYSDLFQPTKQDKLISLATSSANSCTESIQHYAILSSARRSLALESCLWIILNCQRIQISWLNLLERTCSIDTQHMNSMQAQHTVNCSKRSELVECIADRSQMTIQWIVARWPVVMWFILLEDYPIICSVECLQQALRE